LPYYFSASPRVAGDIVELNTPQRILCTKEALARERAQLGLDQPIWKQLVTWIVGIPRLDFGTSMWTGQPITHEIAIRLELSIELALMATFVAVLISIPLGRCGGEARHVDRLHRADFSIAGWPFVFLARHRHHSHLRIIFAGCPANLYFVLGRSKANLSQLIWRPGGRLPYSAVATRMTRSAMLEVLRED